MRTHFAYAFVSFFVIAGCSGGGGGYRRDGFIPFGDGGGAEPDLKLGASPDLAERVDLATPVDFTVAPSCFDGIKNGQESDVDCGGPNCSPCANGFQCKGPNDCSSSWCSKALCCDTAHANCDGLLGNGCEVSLQSDGKNCGQCGNACANGQVCNNGVCAGGGNFVDYGPMHTFVGLTTDHFVTQGNCSVNGAHNNDVDAAYFCAHFYGQRLGKNCVPRAGYAIATTPSPTYPKMHKSGGCTTSGSDIPQTVCDTGACKIGNWSETTSGLVNIVCRCM